MFRIHRNKYIYACQNSTPSAAPSPPPCPPPLSLPAQCHIQSQIKLQDVEDLSCGMRMAKCPAGSPGSALSVPSHRVHMCLPTTDSKPRAMWMCSGPSAASLFLSRVICLLNSFCRYVQLILHRQRLDAVCERVDSQVRHQVNSCSRYVELMLLQV